jgi:hypothetical protein
MRHWSEQIVQLRLENQAGLDGCWAYRRTWGVPGAKEATGGPKGEMFLLYERLQAGEKRRLTARQIVCQ